MNRRNFFRLAAAPMAAAVIPVQTPDIERPAAFNRLVRGIDYGSGESFAMFLLFDGRGQVIDAVQRPVSIRQHRGCAEVLANDVTFRSIAADAAPAEAWGIRLPAWNIDYVRPFENANSIIVPNGGDITLQFRDRLALRLQ